MKNNASGNNNSIQQKCVSFYAADRPQKRDIYQTRRGASHLSYKNVDETAERIISMFDGKLVDLQIPMLRVIDFIDIR